MPPRELSLQDWIDGIQAGDRSTLSRAITLLESRRPDHAELAQAILDGVLPTTGGAHRVGITGVPGVGKSSFIEAMGMRLVERGHRVAVLAVDPSSSVSGGSILGDKSRMDDLARSENAFIRPSPSARSVGGVGRRTREILMLCEAARYDIVFVETVGVGQSETIVAEMVDCFLFLALPGAGDELQGIKRGILEMADLIAVNKADGEQLPLARSAAADYNSVLRLLRPRSPAWRARTMLVSAQTGDGLDELWQNVLEHRAALEASGEWKHRRDEQLRHWMWSIIHERLREAFESHPEVTRRLQKMEIDVCSGRVTPSAAAKQLLTDFGIEG